MPTRPGIDFQAYITKTGSHSMTMNRKGHFAALIKRAMPELQHINGLREQEKILREEINSKSEIVQEMTKVLSGCPKNFEEYAKRRNEIGRDVYRQQTKLAAIVSVRKRANSLVHCELFAQIARIMLPGELVGRINDEVVSLMVGAKEELNPTPIMEWHRDSKNEATP